VQRPGEGEEGRHAARIVRDEPLQDRDGVGGAPEPHVGDREVVVGADEARVQAQRRREGPRRVVGPAQLQVGVADVVVLEGGLAPEGVGGAGHRREQHRRRAGGETRRPHPVHAFIIERTAARHNGAACGRRTPASPNIDERIGRRYA